METDIAWYVMFSGIFVKFPYGVVLNCIDS